MNTIFFLFLIKQCEEVKSKYDKEIETLRYERTAIEKVIISQRNECETLKASLCNEFTQTDQLKEKLNQMSKRNKEIENQKLLLLQSLVNKLLPSLISNKPMQSSSDLEDEKKLEE